MPTKTEPAVSARDAQHTGPPRWLRWLLPALLIVAWLAAGSVGGPYFGRVDEVSSNDATSYLPASADATQVQALLPEFSGSDAVPAIVLFTAERKLDQGQLAEITAAAKQFAGLGAVDGEASPVITSDDGRAAQVFVPVRSDLNVGEAVAELREAVRAGAPAGVAVYVTGPAGFTADLAAAFTGIDGLLLAVALGAVLVILMVVYRSPLLPFIVLGTSVFALCVALLTVWWLAKAGVLLLSGQTQGILFILVIGAATDYSLLYVARYREALMSCRTRWDATWAALRGSFEPILASGGTVIAGLLCLLLSDLNSNKALGPVAAIGIVFAMAAALTLLPALLLWAGRAAFWPRRPRFDPAGGRRAEGAEVPRSGAWTRLTGLVARRPRMVWAVTSLVLLAACAGVLQLKADGVPSSDLVLGQSEARDGQAALGVHFPGGSGSPAYLAVPEDRFDEVASALLAADGVESVAVVAADSPGGTARVTADGVQGFGPPGTPAPAPTVVDSRVMLQATLADAADSAAAEQTVRGLRADLGSEVLVGGVTATAIDSNDASIHDRNVIIPVILMVILAILMLLLRSVLAPVLLILTVVLSFGAAMGVSALVFNHILGFPGADPAVPLYGFVFLVALGIDYNIFLMTRVREESLVHGTRTGILRGLSVTGGVITSAGLVLAATFAALGVLPILFLAQLAFIVAFGVLLDTFVVRSLLVPALAYDVGRRIWWPSRLARRGLEGGAR
ncbi:MMPL family transporter [Arthrobacter sp. I2-34]|uniref:MMPL family transporter n=1 Tax=Arthrobacter hankyongi TaxID=2904801 RepID=A0ABS9LBL2_9MICC|nr:MMPL family transporter [Arthrobacter hankyongi]MCG2624072.1 MMPL family transporter [Arthrobacter hankyongi]